MKFKSSVFGLCKTLDMYLLVTRRYSAVQFSPTVMRKKRAQEQQQRITETHILKNYDSQEILPPVELLYTAQSLGVISMGSENALEFLRRYHLLATRPVPGWEQRLCDEFNINPEVVTLLATILRRCKTRPQQEFARTLIHTASTMGDKLATFELVTSALRSNSILRYEKTLVRLEAFANQGDQQAILLLAKVLFQTEAIRESLAWLQRAMRSPKGNLDFDGAGEALTLEGRILQMLNDKSGAKAAFEKAAKDLNDPEAYFHLSQMEEVLDNQYTYLLNSAIMGVTEACHSLGVLELKKICEKYGPSKELIDYGLAKEWFLIAAHDGNGHSMLKLAEIYKSCEHMSEAKEWLKKASLVPISTLQANRLNLEWKYKSNDQGP
ncbi:Bgt-3413 [Blumeria graminis f. sp. tritici]|uniref:Bgt-3413 n=2 Tax=Blumeria graminis f. sp. tritici TaxID=62690 RepID=A0A381LEH1_BLUGR|nr:hypothetical protein BGT96224_3413 [Blumeria graminis f. sp. tritici 96224]VDB93321.1 Bgt-3413 [Blumeria graminis f. sp. tritici]